MLAHQREDAYRHLQEFLVSMSGAEDDAWDSKHLETIDCPNCEKPFETLIECSNTRPGISFKVDETWRWNADRLLERLSEILVKDNTK